MCLVKTVYFIRVHTYAEGIAVRFENQKTLKTKMDSEGGGGEEVRRNIRLSARVFRALAASPVLYKRTEHSRYCNYDRFQKQISCFCLDCTIYVYCTFFASECPQSCHCKPHWWYEWLKDITCYGKNLTSVPRQLPTNIGTL